MINYIYLFSNFFFIGYILFVATKEDARSITVTVLENINKLLVPLGNQRLEEQINLLVSSMEITVEEKAERMRICRSLQNFLSISFPGCIFRPFGSVVAGLAFRGCDLDLRIENSQGNFQILLTLKVIQCLRNWLSKQFYSLEWLLN